MRCGSTILRIAHFGCGFAPPHIDGWLKTKAAVVIQNVILLVFDSSRSHGSRAARLRPRGGYVAGRLRTRWVGVHTHEIFFRDTAHGFLAWALATVIGAGFLAAAASNIAGSASPGIAKGHLIGATGLGQIY